MTLNDKPHDNEKKIDGPCFVNINTPVIELSNTKQKTKRGWTKFFLCFISLFLSVLPSQQLSYPTSQQPANHLFAIHYPPGYPVPSKTPDGSGGGCSEVK